ncbi:glycoside hydrolase domain-containing protein [Saccharothrix syringae]|uniref:DUF1906 domain-containing protein n=1 Tax=Saccharothrix syringae TaxID=103733 RepID=A0A5Q0H5L8_SACSY|nr:glycoside hydrolase domain-containing protein [Saccharothrix syringae]QFZ21486.1 DUF1906 domain-containing protein [Saccharothrix syringae]
MDEKVLEAQRWVNATYRAAPGYEPCPENGRTGWATVYALTMGLQHELGISPVVAGFGPGTLARLRARGPIGPGEPNANICDIVQYGLFAKGYWGGAGEGRYSSVTAAAVREMADDLGVATEEPYLSLSPKLFKALLSMDACVLTAGGSEKVREVQRWLNGRYQHRSTYFLGPCDGHFSRDVQQALVKAIQYEVGIPEEQANGNFGPGTQEGLRRNEVAEGASGIFVRLFSAACVFNEPVDDTVTTFKETFDARLREFVEAFQRFSALDVTGRGDFRTWAQLLVSTGDPSRPATACDTRFTITPARARVLYDAGYRYVGRYLEDPPGSTLDKQIQPGELEGVFGTGMRVFPIWQYSAREPADFTYAKGFDDALRAHARGLHHGFNHGTVIYFAVDYDATQAEIESNVVPYFNGVVAGLANQGKRYVHGVYGSRNVCAQVTKHTQARWSFVSGMSWGFSGNLGFPLPANWAFNQVREFRFTAGADAFDLDNDVHRPGADAGQGSVNQPVDPSDGFVAHVEGLHRLATVYDSSRADRLVAQYARHRRYDDFQWQQLIGPIDRGFVDYAESRGASPMTEFLDGFTGHALGVEHLMATFEGHLAQPGPAAPGAVDRGDVAGWGGDLMTFYGEWRRDSGSYSSGYTYCADRLAQLAVSSSFGFADLVEDADGYLLARAVRGGASIVDAVRRHYAEDGSLTRFRDYVGGRFGGADGVVALAREVLTADDDPVISLGRTYLVQSTGGVPTLMPAMLTEDKLTEFLRGFADVLRARVGHEGQRRAAVLEQRRRAAEGER